MTVNISELTQHDMSDDCPVCKAQDMVAAALLPAAAAWEVNAGLPRFSVALHGAAELLGVMLAEGVSRADIDGALGELLDEIESQIAEDDLMGGPPQGSA